MSILTGRYCWPATALTVSHINTEKLEFLHENCGADSFPVIVHRRLGEGEHATRTGGTLLRFFVQLLEDLLRAATNLSAVLLRICPRRRRQPMRIKKSQCLFGVLSRQLLLPVCQIRFGEGF